MEEIKKFPQTKENDSKGLFYSPISLVSNSLIVGENQAPLKQNEKPVEELVINTFNNRFNH